MWAMKRVVVVLPLTPRDGDDGDAAVVAVGKEHVDDGLADGAGNAHRRLKVHARARGRR